jgi:hypothetical protein
MQRLRDELRIMKQSRLGLAHLRRVADLVLIRNWIVARKYDARRTVEIGKRIRASGR